MDKSGRAALVETLDGRMAVKQIDGGSRQMLCATNHPVLPELVPHEPQALVHSLRRYEWIGEQLGSPSAVTVEQLQAMLLAKYPDGLCCHYFEEFFGTTKSMVIDPAAGVIHLCWGGRAENGWQVFDIREPLVGAATDIQLNFEKADPAIHRFQPL